MTRLTDLLIVISLCLSSAIAGASLRRVFEPMSCNAAMSAGFRIYDAEGFEVERFDEVGDYWTTTPK